MTTHPDLPTEADPRVAFTMTAARPAHSTSGSADSPAPQPVGVLVIHGFTGSVYSVRDWALNFTPEHSVVVPALPGHESTWEDLSTTTWQQWYTHVADLLAELAASHERVVVAGFSMGGALALRLAEAMPEVVDGVVVVNPALSLHNRAARAASVLRHAVKSTRAVGSDVAKEGVDEYAYGRTPTAGVAQLNRLMRLTIRELAKITVPVLVLRSRQDHVVSKASHELIMQRCSGPVEAVVLPRSYHVATLDHEADVVLNRSREFVDAVAAGHCSITGGPLPAARSVSSAEPVQGGCG